MKIEIKQHSKYLVFYLGTTSVITILNITKTSYQLEHENKSTQWITMKNFEASAQVIEDVTDLNIYKPTIESERNVVEFEAILENCYICHGAGTVIDTKSTAGTKTCPHCHGAKMILKTTFIRS